jgi:hypothetical protein
MRVLDFWEHGENKSILNGPFGGGQNAAGPLDSQVVGDQATQPPVKLNPKNPIVFSMRWYFSYHGLLVEKVGASDGGATWKFL